MEPYSEQIQITSDTSEQQIIQVDSHKPIEFSDIDDSLILKVLQYLDSDQILLFGWCSIRFLKLSCNNSLWEDRVFRTFGNKFLPRQYNYTEKIDYREIYFGFYEFFCLGIEETSAPWPPHTKFRVIDAHKPTGGRTDEIELRIGDIVRVHECFVPHVYVTKARSLIRSLQINFLVNRDDEDHLMPFAMAHTFLKYLLPCDRRWCAGVNLETGEAGSFRFSCIRMIEGSGGPSTVYAEPEFIWPGESFLDLYIMRSLQKLDKNQRQLYANAEQQIKKNDIHTENALLATSAPDDAAWLLQSPVPSGHEPDDDDAISVRSSCGSLELPEIDPDFMTDISTTNSPVEVGEYEHLTVLSPAFALITTSVPDPPQFQLPPNVMINHNITSAASTPVTLKPAFSNSTLPPSLSLGKGVLPPSSLNTEIFSDDETLEPQLSIASIVSLLNQTTLSSTPTLDYPELRNPSPASSQRSSDSPTSESPALNTITTAVNSPKTQSTMIPHEIAKFDLLDQPIKESASVVGKKLTVARKYIPERMDEIILREGDLVEVTKHWEDNWCEGINLTLGIGGVFPLECCKAV